MPETPESPTRPHSTAALVTGRRVTSVTTPLLFAAWVVDYVDRLVITLALAEIATISASTGRVRG